MSFLKQEQQGIPWKTLVNGGIVGAVEAVLTYPTECALLHSTKPSLRQISLLLPHRYVKTMLQLQSKTNPEFRGIWDCVAKTVKNHGVTGTLTVSTVS